jgi:hypothetical protein
LNVAKNMNIIYMSDIELIRIQKYSSVSNANMNIEEEKIIFDEYILSNILIFSK